MTDTNRVQYFADREKDIHRWLIMACAKGRLFTLWGKKVLKNYGQGPAMEIKDGDWIVLNGDDETLSVEQEVEDAKEV